MTVAALEEDSLLYCGPRKDVQKPVTRPLSVDPTQKDQQLLPWAAEVQ